MMHKLTWFVLVTALALPAKAAAQVMECQGFPNVTSIAVGQSVARPMGFSPGATVSVLPLTGVAPENAILKDVGAMWSQGNVDQLRGLVGASEAFLVWTQLGAPSCRYRFSLAVAQPPAVLQPVQPAAPPGQQAAPPGLAGRAVGRRYRADECLIAGQEWINEVAPRSRNVSVILFDDAGQLCFPPPVRPRQGDPIYVGIFTGELSWGGSRITFQPCMLESATPNVLATGRLSDISQIQSEGPTHRVFAFPVRYCWNSPVAIEITAADGNRRMNYALEQVTLYRATLHLGTVFTENHEVTFGLRPDGTNKRIFAQGPVDRGPEYVAALVFYSLPRYFSRGGVHGRDPVADNSWKDKLGGVIGVGLRNPTKRFVTGFSVEIAAGVNAIGVWDWVETSVLTGVSEGDVFTGLPEEIPTQREWRQKFVMGVTLDIVYAATAFRR